MPEVSVIVPARDAEATLGRSLDALSRQDFTGEWELIVVDDGSRDSTGDLARAAGATVVPGNGTGGAAGARNLGAARASSALLAFTDADCEPRSNWLSAGVASLARWDLVQGAVRPLTAGHAGPFDRTLNVQAESDLFETANLFVKRAVFDRVGGFMPFLEGEVDEFGQPLRGLLPRRDEGPFGEDTWFGWRAKRSGARSGFAPDAVVEHAIFPRGERGYLRERWRLRYFPSLVRVVPELRASLTFRIFLTTRSAGATAALLCIVASAASGRRLPLLGCLPYLRLAAPAGLGTGDLRSATGLAAGDAVGLMASSIGAVRAGRLVL